MSGAREWDGAAYDRISDPQLRWAESVLERADLQTRESILDAGCGSGRVTELIADRARPGARIAAADGSAQMLEVAGERLGPGVELIHTDLLELDREAEFDLIISTATFHWITDHELLFRRLRRALRPGGALVAQCGGEGNVRRFYAAVEQVIAADPELSCALADRPETFLFAGPEETERRLLGAGFERAECWLEPQPTTPPDPREFIRAVCLGAHLEPLEPGLAERLLEKVWERVGPEPVLDYVRLNISAGAAAGDGEEEDGAGAAGADRGSGSSRP